MMIKVLIAHNIYRALQQKSSFLDRSDVMVFTASSHTEVLAIHRTERADLIISQFNLPWLADEGAGSMIREDAVLKRVPSPMICYDTADDVELRSRCGTEVVLPCPVKPERILAKAKELLRISWRRAHRTPVCVAIEGSACDETFSCRSLDISATGMLMETDRGFSLSDRLICSFCLPRVDTTRIEAPGEISRIINRTSESDAHRYGVHFRDLTPEARMAIQDFLTAVAR